MKIMTAILIMALSLVVTLTVGFIWRQSAKNMINLETINNLQRYGVEIVSSTDANFNAEMIQYTGGRNTVVPLVEAAKPLAIFIKNNSPKDIIGVSLRWNFVKLNGEVHTSRQIESITGGLMGRKPIDPWMVGKTNLINGCFSRQTAIESLQARKIREIKK